LTPAQQMRAISLGSGGIAGAAVGLLIYAFWPQPAKLAAALRGPVAQPVFVEPVEPKRTPVSTPAQAAAPPSVASAQAAPAPAAPVQQASRGIAIVAAASAAAPVAKADDQARSLFADGLALLAQGEIAPARLLLQRAADSGESRALLALGDSYDPTALARLGAVGVKGDPAKAKDCYAKAVDAGVAEARERLAQLQQ